jgi:hypothetical protein
MTGSTDGGLRMRQHEVQRLLGQCLLRLQAYERLMKAIVAHHDISGSAPSLDKAQASRLTDIGRKTLGTLVSHLLESFLTTDEKRRSAESSVEPLANEHTGRVRIQIDLPAGDFARTENGLKELVLLRNNLVHHFLEWHDLGSLDGCRAAESALIDASGRIKQHFDDLRQWTDDLVQTRLHLAEVIQSDAIRDLIVMAQFLGPSPRS